MRISHYSILNSQLPGVLLLRGVAPLVGQAVFPAAPARVHAIRRLLQDGFDAADLPFFHPEHFGNLPGERTGWPTGNVAAVGCLIVSGVSRRMVEKRKT